MNEVHHLILHDIFMKGTATKSLPLSVLIRWIAQALYNFYGLGQSR
jgi:hypothetical protein